VIPDTRVALVSFSLSLSLSPSRKDPKDPATRMSADDQRSRRGLSKIRFTQDDKLARAGHRDHRRDSVADDRDGRLGGVQRGNLRQCREQMHAHAELQVRPGHLYLLQGMFLVPELLVRRMLFLRR